MHAPAPMLHKPAPKWTEGLFGNEKGEDALEKAAAVKSVYLDQEFASPGSPSYRTTRRVKGKT